MAPAALPRCDGRGGFIQVSLRLLNRRLYSLFPAPK